jgi:hypothetical protein
MNEFDKTIMWLHSVGIGYKVMSFGHLDELYSNKDLSRNPVKFEDLKDKCLIKIGGHSRYSKHEGYSGFYAAIKFDQNGELTEFGTWE